MPRQRQSRRSQASRRFLVRTPEGVEEPQPKAETPGAALSKALNLAAHKDAQPGVWEVQEYEDVLYRVHRLPAEKLDVRVEVLR